jgi:nitric oxide reductase activation protein
MHEDELYNPLPRDAARNDARRPAPPPFDHTAALQDYARLLDKGIRYFAGETGYYSEYFPIAARLIKTSIALGAALNQTPERQFTHRIVVEHVARKI